MKQSGQLISKTKVSRSMPDQVTFTGGRYLMHKSPKTVPETRVAAVAAKTNWKNHLESL